MAIRSSPRLCTQATSAGAGSLPQQYISFLPLAHSFETCMQISLICAGGSIGFYGGNLKTLATVDIPELKPTVMAGVPRVYQRIYDKVMAKMEAKGGVVQSLFLQAIENQKYYGKQGDRSGFWDFLVLDKVKEHEDAGATVQEHG